ncbi:MAG TPA: trypsin-like serine protease [Polyangiaceae bacterium]
MKHQSRTKLRALCSSVALCAAAWQLPACSSEPDSEHAGSTDQDVIAGFAASGAKLNAIGSIGQLYWDEWTQTNVFYPYCSGSLIGEKTVLTAKHCLDYFAMDYSWGVKTGFGVGPDGNAPERVIEVVDVEGAPNDQGGFVGYGHDVGAMYLGESVTDLTPLEIGTLTRSSLGRDFVHIGYGVRDNSFSAGTRRLGKSELVALEGKVFEILFGSFEAFKSWWETGSPTAQDAPFVTGPVAPGAFLFVARSMATLADEPPVVGAAGAPPGSGGSSTGGSGPIGGAPTEGGSGPNPEDEFLRYIYDTTVLTEGYEAIFGGTEGDAQVCYGDSGSPIVRSVKGQLFAYGVVSGGVGSSSLVCDFGGVHSIFGPEVLTFLDEAKAWVDPCDGLSVAGVCASRRVAKRCTDPNEGPRRPIEFDCGLVGQVCAVQPDGTAGCSDP